MNKYRSWAYIPDTEQKSVRPVWADFSLDADSILPYGNGRSYGDSCLNVEGTVIDSRSLNRFIGFDEKTGILKCEACITFADILAVIVPKNWFLPVTPGTKFVTLGGAIANDVHGKNHHTDGTFGMHVLRFELMRSNGDTLLCSPEENVDYFSATIGGLGLTGFIKWAEIQLIKITSPFIRVETTAFHGLEEFYKLSEAANRKHHYSVAWLDCASSGKNFARGLFMAGDHANHNKPAKAVQSEPKFSVPFNFPQKALNRYSIKAFNALYFNKNSLMSSGISFQHYDSFFYPLDGLGDWNRIYGKQGFYQYQFVVPSSEKATMEKILNKIVASGLGSFLAVLKEFGDLKSPGMLSFPRSGLCLALDFANRGEITLKLADELDELVMQAGGAVYPAKDIRMS
ncbi:MAG: FAD-binding oxidoreductase, partial [Thiotrichaceae bacterium]|nr:FAD-binding oxidoreductase [Thiotrichaceae bacterium]